MGEEERAGQSSVSLHIGEWKSVLSVLQSEESTAVENGRQEVKEILQRLQTAIKQQLDE